MKIQDLNGKSVCILGYGKEGQAVFHAIERYAPHAQVTIADKNPETLNQLIAGNSPTNPIKLKSGITTQSGENAWLRAMDTFEVIIKSPGIPLLPELIPFKDKITSSTQIFLDSIQGTGAIVIGVTGSKGKSTTSSLIYAILKAAGRNVFFIGNIGEPAISHIGDAQANTIFVSEMSSYQLADLTTSPHIAVVTSFFPEHLDYHGSTEAYLDAKKNIARYQTKDDVILYDATSDGAKEIANESKGQKIPFSIETAPKHTEPMKLIGKHNERNIAAALATVQLPELSIEPGIALDAVKEFPGLPHRLEYCGEHAGIRYYEDSISTTPESTIAAIEALNDEIDTIILGGLDRGYDFSELGKKIASSSVKHVILFPESGSRIREAIVNAKAQVTFHETVDMQEAVTIAQKNTASGKVCLLSPASPSYNLFKNFEERGDKFKELVAKL